MQKEDDNTAACTPAFAAAASSEVLAERLAAIASTQRLAILAAVISEPLHVSELARRVQMSRALLYMHLRKLEDAGFVTSERRLAEDGKVTNVYSPADFSLTITPAVIAVAVAATHESED